MVRGADTRGRCGRADELVVTVALAAGGRPLARIGDGPVAPPAKSDPLAQAARTGKGPEPAFSVSLAA